MLRFYKGSPRERGRQGILPAAFNPPTKAHFALAEAAREQHHLDQFVFLLPQKFPHKPYVEASFDDRIAMLKAGAGPDPAYAVAASEKGLFVDIAWAFRQQCGPAAELYLLCGSDAARRIVNWDYRDRPSFAEQLKEFQILVAPRRERYPIPTEFQDRMHYVELPPGLEEISSSGVREAVRTGKPWRPWTPEAVASEIEKRRLYRERGS